MDTITCTVDGCTNKHAAKGLCQKHYSRLWRTGTTDLIERTFEDLYNEKVKPEGDCLVWAPTPSTKGKSHPYAQYKGRTMPAHRAVWFRAGREIPEDYEINHKCWTFGCVNLAHLEAVTRSENQHYRQGPNKNNTSGYLNVYYRKRSKKWSAQVNRGGKNHYGPLRVTPEEASKDAERLRSQLASV